MTRRHVLVLGLLVSAGCGKSKSAGKDPAGGGAGGGTGKVPAGVQASIGQGELENGVFLTVTVACPGQNVSERSPGTRYVIKGVRGEYGSSWCMSDKAKLSVQIEGNGAEAPMPVFEIEGQPRKGAGYTLQVPVLPSKQTWLWLSSLYTIVAPEGQAASPGLKLWVDRFAVGAGQLADGKLRFQLSVPALGGTITLDGKDIPGKTAVEQRTSPARAVDGGAVKFDYSGGFSKHAVELALDPAVFETAIETLEWGNLPLPKYAFKFHHEAGDFEGELTGQIMLATAARDVEKGPLWFVTPGSKPARNGVYLSGDERNPGFTFGKGKVGELGVVVVTTPADVQKFSACKYQGGYTVERSGHNLNAKAYDPRTGQVLGEKKISAKAPSCPAEIGVSASTPAVMGSGSDVDSAVVERWALSLVK
ncbi:MAG: hypothetical protein IT370_15340 [Deltaproteobacteria bacterium]|nr:hypothetical protein [Deltaproteobacteria bacterium]